MNHLYNAPAIKAELDEYVLGQDEGTRKIATAVFFHLNRLRAHKENPASRIRKDNVLLIGPTGCGKTETFRVLQRMQNDFGIPVIMKNALDYSPSKTWQGEPLDAIFSDLGSEALRLFSSQNDGRRPISESDVKAVSELASNGIVLIDEFDKLRTLGNENDNYYRDYQSRLLKLVEGCTIQAGVIRRGNHETGFRIDTSSIMFIFLGAFEGLEEVTRERLLAQRTPSSTHRNSIGFLADIRPVSSGQIEEDLPAGTDLTPSLDDLVEYGVKRELAGRFPIRAVYREMSLSGIVKILKESKTSAYLEYQERFSAMGHSLFCDDDALREIARRAMEQNSGARALSNVFFDLLEDVSYELSAIRNPIRCILRGSDIRIDRQPLVAAQSTYSIDMEQLIAGYREADQLAYLLSHRRPAI